MINKSTSVQETKVKDKGEGKIKSMKALETKKDTDRPKEEDDEGSLNGIYDRTLDERRTKRRVGSANSTRKTYKQTGILSEKLAAVSYLESLSAKCQLSWAAASN